MVDSKNTTHPETILAERQKTLSDFYRPKSTADCRLSVELKIAAKRISASIKRQQKMNRGAK